MTEENKSDGLSLPKYFDHAEAEARLYDAWEEAGCFKPSGVGEPYCIVIPPPNVTGSLHMGHALNNTLQDILVRFHRMRGRDTLWQVGTDHAGIATQMVVERQMMERQEPGRREIGREAFVQKVWDWKAESAGTIQNQLRRLGASCDWSRERIVGKLCEIPVGPKAHRRLIPIITDEYPDPDFGSGAVKITGAHDFNDYDVAKRNNIPLYRLMDEQAVMRTDGAAYAEESAKAMAIAREGLGDSDNVDAINLVPEEYRGLDRYDARKKGIADIDAEGLMSKVEDKQIQQPLGDRSGVVIEPMLTDQWYVDAPKMAVEAQAAVDDGRTRFIPDNWKKTYDNWLNDIQPWCISRQLWWGHRIPVWYSARQPSDDLKLPGALVDKIFVYETEDEAVAAATNELNASVEIVEATNDQSAEYRAIRQVEQDRKNGVVGKAYLWRDPDVLDTWFSSALWPFSTLGWPEDTPELQKYYPTATLSTAFDIIFFWVARMMMMGLYFKKEVPFKDVYIHAIVRDEKGQKMSKSKGNVIDPLGKMDEYGTDSLRFTLAAMAAPGRDVKLADSRIEGYRNFRTKLWNAARFVEMNECSVPEGYDPAAGTLPLAKWILHRASAAEAAITTALETYRFDDAANAIYQFTWNIYCDWFLEFAKPVFQGEDEAAKAEIRATGAYVLDRILTLLHPFMPFVTEELWASTGRRDKFLMVSDWHAPVLEAPEADADLSFVIDLISEVRSVRTEMNVPPSAKLPLVALNVGEATKGRLTAFADLIERVARLEGISHAAEPPKGAAQIVVAGETYGLPIADFIDLSAEMARLEKSIGKTQGEIDKIDKQLGNAKFVERAPQAVVDEKKEQRAEFTGTLEKLTAALERLKAL